MAHEDQWHREKAMRQINADVMLDGMHVMEILESFVLDEKAIQYCALHEELKSDTGTVYRYLIVMPAAVSDRVWS